MANTPSNPNNGTALQKLTQFDILERRSQVQKLRLRGLTTKAISNFLNVSPKTVQRDLDSIREDNLRKLAESTKEDYLSEAISRYEEIEERAWAEYSAAADGSTQKLKALELVKSIQGDKIKALRDTGFIQPAQQQMEVKHVHQLDWSDEMQDKVAMSLLEQGLTPQLAEPIPEAEIIDVDEVDNGIVRDTDTETVEETEDSVDDPTP